VPAPTQRFVNAVRLISQLCGFVAAGMIAAGVLVVCHMVFVRYVLNHNTIWQTDLTTYFLIGATFIGSPYVLMTRGHVNVDVLPHYMGRRARWWLAVFSGVLTLAFSIVLAVVFLTWNANERTLSIHSIYTPRRESFYWATVLATFALGTAAGDMTARTLKLGYFSS